MIDCAKIHQVSTLRKLSGALVVGMAFFGRFVDPCEAWEAKATHPVLTRQAMRKSAHFDRVLKEMGLRNGLTENVQNGSGGISQSAAAWCELGATEEDAPLCAGTRHFHRGDWLPGGAAPSPELDDMKATANLILCVTQNVLSDDAKFESALAWLSNAENPWSWQATRTAQTDSNLTEATVAGESARRAHDRGR